MIENIRKYIFVQRLVLYISISTFLTVTSCSTNKTFKWTNGNIFKAEKLGLDTAQVLILASLVEKETELKNEKGKIARVYLNRIEKDMLLQSDPTVKYAIGDTSLKRLLKQQIETDSPYNTYKYRGLPPGPICKPTKETIIAVLKCKKHEYLYFCLAPDLNGKLNYASTYKEHSKNAKLYIDALNKKAIK
ncbi:MAG: endolytic transglycosylase MltG [Vicingaceae bacterium]|nr:endolytic transglycosylase MltG [Vicingaceae bacterium]